jgi:hypothetical protein
MFSNAYLTHCNTNKDTEKQHQNTIGIGTWIENLKESLNVVVALQHHLNNIFK